MKPTQGCIVLYAMPESVASRFHKLKELPAIVVDVAEGSVGTVCLLFVLEPERPHFVYSVPQSEQRTNPQGSWRWPPRE
jgi:hypothetical protein